MRACSWCKAEYEGRTSGLCKECFNDYQRSRRVGEKAMILEARASRERIKELETAVKILREQIRSLERSPGRWT